jgi:hypothetical protein
MLIDPIPSAHVDVKLFRMSLRLMLSKRGIYLGSGIGPGGGAALACDSDE